MPKKSDTKKVDFKETLWKSADKLRNQMDAAEYKHIVLGLIFLKYPESKAALYIVHNDLPHKAAALPDSFAICANVSNRAKLLQKLVIAILFLVLLIIFIKLSLNFSSDPE